MTKKYYVTDTTVEYPIVNGKLDKEHPYHRITNTLPGTYETREAAEAKVEEMYRLTKELDDQQNASFMAMGFTDLIDNTESIFEVVEA